MSDGSNTDSDVSSRHSKQRAAPEPNIRSKYSSLLRSLQQSNSLENPNLLLSPRRHIQNNQVESVSTSSARQEQKFQHEEDLVRSFKDRRLSQIFHYTIVAAENILQLIQTMDQEFKKRHQELLKIIAGLEIFLEDHYDQPQKVIMLDKFSENKDEHCFEEINDKENVDTDNKPDSDEIEEENYVNDQSEKNYNLRDRKNIRRPAKLEDYSFCNICDARQLCLPQLLLFWGFSLNDALVMIEDVHDSARNVNGIVIFPPINACADITDADSGNENTVSINNLSGSHLQAVAEFLRASDFLYSDEEDDIFLSELQSPQSSTSKLKFIQQKKKFIIR
ncbi:hypothetical protein RN001_010070 [Aquatica leii]|uniref:Uncharacterized protein n=1 Tax=Aquatica leii TaxID=1421715 RepID=A0AAN7PUE1_9COLE|nr:hypothetical protein RN001_010070 [Aquatica leii]